MVGRQLTVIKKPRDDPIPDYPIRFSPFDNLHLELLENKKKLKKGLPLAPPSTRKKVAPPTTTTTNTNTAAAVVGAAIKNNTATATKPAPVPTTTTAATKPVKTSVLPSTAPKPAPSTAAKPAPSKTAPPSNTSTTQKKDETTNIKVASVDKKNAVAKSPRLKDDVPTIPAKSASKKVAKSKAKKAESSEGESDASKGKLDGDNTDASADDDLVNQLAVRGSGTEGSGSDKGSSEDEVTKALADKKDGNSAAASASDGESANSSGSDGSGADSGEEGSKKSTAEGQAEQPSAFEEAANNEDEEEEYDPYAGLTPEEREAKEKQEYMWRFHILKKKYKNTKMPDFNEHSDLQHMKSTYDRTVKELYLDESVDTYRNYLIGGFVFMEFICTQWIGIDMKGFTKQQAMVMNKYESLLVELGERSYNRWNMNLPVEVRLIGFILLQAAIFFVGKKIAEKAGSGIGELFKGVTGQPPTAATAAAASTEPAQKAMRGPSLRPNDIKNMKQD